MEKDGCDERQEKVTLLLSLPSFRFYWFIIGYNKSIVLQQDMIVLKYFIPLIVAM